MPDSLRSAIRDVVDFPKPGIVFKDITPILASGPLFRRAIDLLCETTGGRKIEKVVGIDARGFIFASAVADLAVDELADMTNITEDEARALIMKAREHWFEQK